MRTKLTTLLIGIVLVTVVVVSTVSLFLSRRIVRQAASARLISVRADRAAEVEHLFSVLRNELALLAQTPLVTDAIKDFTRSFDELDNSEVPAGFEESLSQYYDEEFLPNLEVNIRQELDIEQYLPKNAAGIYLQNHYIVKNENLIGSKELLDQAVDGSDYSAAHLIYHPLMRSFIDLFDYYDVFLVDAEKRNVIYSVYKEIDYGTNLIDGPYANSGLATAVDLSLTEPSAGKISVVDFTSYDPSLQTPAAFFATPIMEEETVLGVLVVQVPIDEINNVMTSNQEWVSRGMGETGESYLVGSDYLMRSMSRLMIEDRAAYSKALRDGGTASEVVDRILNLDTSILHQEIKSESVELALGGESGIHIIQDHREVNILSAYAPLKITGLDWTVIVEIEESEINAPIVAQQPLYLQIIGGVILFILLLGFYIINRFTRPFRRLAATASPEAKQLDLPEKFLNSKDEFGQLATTFNQTLSVLQQQQIEVDNITRENEQLYLSILPAPIAARVKGGEHDIAEEVQNVTLMFAYLRGIHELAVRINNPKKTAELLNILTARFETASTEFNVRREPTLSNRFTAICGLDEEEGDRIETIVRYAITVQRITRAFNAEFGSNLMLQIGIHSGNMLATVLQTDAFRFELWGSTVEITDMLETHAGVDTILVSHEVYLRVQHLYTFEPHEPVELENDRRWRAWTLIPPEEDGEESTRDRFAYALARAARKRTLPRSLKPRKKRTRQRFIHT